MRENAAESELRRTAASSRVTAAAATQLPAPRARVDAPAKLAARVRQTAPRVRPTDVAVARVTADRPRVPAPVNSQVGQPEDKTRRGKEHSLRHEMAHRNWMQEYER